MAIDKSKAQEADNGFIPTDDGIEGPFYTGGPSSPVGLALDQGTYYVQNTGSKVVIWQKFGAGDNDWRVYPAADISFDPTGLQNFDPTDTNAQLALAKFGDFTVSDLGQEEAFNSLTQETTTSNGWVSKSGFPWTTINNKTAGEFVVAWSSEVGQTKTNRNFGFRVRARPTGGTWVTLGEVELSVNRDDDLFMQSGFQEITLPTDNTIEIDIQFGQTTQGNSAIIRNVSVEVQRTGDLP